MRPFWVYTKAHRPVVNVITWRLNPETETYAKLTPWYRPTHTQLSIPHPSVIDWVPFPSLRDRLILLHSCNPRLDEIICDIADCYVMEIDFSKLVAGAESCMVYVWVLDLIDSISGAEKQQLLTGRERLDATRQAGQIGFGSVPDVVSQSIPVSNCGDNSHGSFTQPESLPASSVAAIFSSKALALQAFRLLGMDRGPGAMKLDPTFFERHPELYDGRRNDNNFLARGIAIQSPFRAGKVNSTPIPGRLDDKILTKYTQMAKWYIDVSVEEDGGML